MNHSINTASHGYHPTTNKITVALLIVLVTGFGLFAESHARQIETAVETNVETNVETTVTTEQASLARNHTDQKTATSI